MHANRHAADADEKRNQQRGSDDINLCAAGWKSLGNDHCEREIDDYRKHRMAARIAGIPEIRQMRNDVWPVAMKIRFEPLTQRAAARGCHNDERGSTEFPLHEKVAKHEKCYEREDGRTPKRCDGNTRGLHPVRTDQMAGIAGYAQCEHDPILQGMGFTFQDLIGNRQEEPEARGDNARYREK